MNQLDTYKSELKKLQDERDKYLRSLRETKSRIENTVKLIQSIENSTIDKKVIFDYIKRDVELCFNFIKNNPNCSSKKIVEHLNSQLKNQYVRWKYLDTNTFTTVMGNYLIKSGNFSCEFKIVDGRQSRVWTLKNI